MEGICNVCVHEASMHTYGESGRYGCQVSEAYQTVWPGDSVVCGCTKTFSDSGVESEAMDLGRYVELNARVAEIWDTIAYGHVGADQRALAVKLSVEHALLASSAMLAIDPPGVD